MNAMSMLAEQERHHSMLMKIILDQLEDERHKLKIATEALESISDTDPDDGTRWFHNVSEQALARMKEVG